jgi:hypothetical protein
MPAPTPELDGWLAVYRRDADGAITSDESVRISRSVVPRTDDGARHLARRYWLAVRRASRGLVRSRESAAGVELRVLAGPCVLRLAAPQLSAGADGVRCRYAIAGGLLARRAGGSLTLCDSGTQLRAVVAGFVPRLGALAFQRLQHRLHVAVSRRFFTALLAEAGP